ncbi:protein ALP1-like [Rhagoletis pomonella]|uniref:protein ALP1-like n=1 Tax=Rhagoletis pomonella TaxID=28610 RepID=UPI00178568D8|nr:protein ALP1-like [Rhagoletis pomonella]XP_036344940.1 protein ALP1-like [Rhagoletis pomonella]
MEIWEKSAQGFQDLWQFPNCVGSIDGKHVTIKCPKKTGSNYWCYLHKFSVVLMAIVGPDYKFLCVDVGGFGRNSDGGIFEASNMGKKFEENLMNMPLPKNLPNQSQPCQCVLIGDEAFGLKPYLMRPFPYKQSKHDLRKEKYNYRLCRARRVVENAFGILAQKFRIFFRPIETKISTTILTIKTACVLHNYLIEKKSDSHLFHNLQSPEPRTQPFIGMSTDSRRASNLAFSTRELFVTYFNNQHEPTAGTVGSERAQNTTEPVFE